MKKPFAGGLFGIMIFLLLVPICVYSQLTREWAATYDGGTQDHIGFDRVYDLHVDANGNAVLVGETEPAPFSKFITTIKYDPSGNMVWKRDYDITPWLTPVEAAISSTMDQDGNIYIANQGTVEGKSGWVVIKYNPDGELVKTMVFGGASDVMDVPGAITTDIMGNIYITGKFNTGGLNWDCATIKADSAGNQIWTSIYDSGAWDIGLDLCLDNAGNVFVAEGATGFGTDDDIVTLKYNPQGELQWVNDYNGGGEPFQPDGSRDDWAVDIQTDAWGDVYITGYSQFELDGPYGIVTIKYSANGSEIWQRRIENAMVNDMHVDPAGNVYLTGYAVDEEGWNDLLACHYSADGALIWKTVYQHSLTGDDQGISISTDSKGNVYIAGQINEGIWPGNIDIIVLCLNDAGNIIGSDFYNGKDNLDDVAVEIETMQDGSIYVAGMDDAWNDALDYLLLKYLPVGTAVETLNSDKVFTDLPKDFMLNQNFPNPFNSTTTIAYQLKKNAEVGLFLYDASGCLVKTFVKESQTAGAHWVSINGDDLPSGTYIYRLQVDGQSEYNKMVLLR